MKYSIIVPVFNARKFIERCIESVVKQTVNDWELILIDDGSTDNSAELCINYTRKYDSIQFFKQENQGVSATRNRGLDIATGEYIIFLDADDELTLDALQILTTKINCYSPDIVVYNTKRIDDNSFPYSDFTKPMFKSDNLLIKQDFVKYIYPKLISDSTLGIIGNYAVKKSVLDNIRFDCSFLMCEDLIFNMQMYENAQNALFIPNYFYLYRDNLSGCVQGYNLKKIDDKKKIVMRKIDFACKHNLIYDKFEIYNWFCSDLIYDYCRIIGDKKKEKDFLKYIYNDNDIMNMYKMLTNRRCCNLKHPNFRYITGNRLVKFCLHSSFCFKMKIKKLVGKR